jgi:hypothetical protein
VGRLSDKDEMLTIALDCDSIPTMRTRCVSSSEAIHSAATLPTLPREPLRNSGTNRVEASARHVITRKSLMWAIIARCGAVRE